MKNIFILPTTEPSQVYLVKSTNALGITSKDPESMKHYGSGTNNLHVYITNKDPYEKGYWVKNVTIDLEAPFPLDADGIMYTTLAPCNFEKIVLTSDPKLIADGVAEIPIEFLRLLKGKKLDDISTIEVEKTPLLSNNGTVLYDYKYTPIILSKEEPKQSALNHFSSTLGVFIKDPKNCDFDKQETFEEAKKQQFKYDNLQDAKEISSRIKVIETLEETAEIFVNNRFSKQISGDKTYPDIYASKEAIVESHILFFKWQQETYNQFILAMDDLKSSRDGYLKAKLEYELKQQENSNENALDFEIKALKSLIQDMDATIKSKYSEEEVDNIIDSFIENLEIYNPTFKVPRKKWFEQFSKLKND
jgi:hypothetical protein